MTNNRKSEIAQHFITCYLAAREGLRELGILRSERNLQGDYAEWLIAETLGLRLAESGVQAGHDATDSEGKTYQIKSRIVSDLTDNTSFDFRDFDDHFDYFVGVFFSPALEPLAIIRVPCEAVVDFASPTETTIRLRWNQAIRDDDRVEYLHRQ